MLCGYVWTFVCTFYLYGCFLYEFLCWKMNVIPEICLKCIFEHLNFIWCSECKLFISSLYHLRFEPILYPWTYILSFISFPCTYIIWRLYIFLPNPSWSSMILFFDPSSYPKWTKQYPLNLEVPRLYYPAI